MVILPARTMLYEIKTAATARGCIRDALGQLLDYGFWPDTPATTHLYVVGEPPLDAITARYLTKLNTCFPAPIAYRQILVDCHTPPDSGEQVAAVAASAFELNPS
jgi:hypothetical protein